MNIHEDFEEFLKLLNKTSVEYVVVGGYAVGFHGYVRFTKDLDILFRNHPTNISNLRSALTHFGFPVESLDDVAFSEQGKVIRMGVKPVMIELINAISGLTFDQVWDNRQAGDYGDAKVFFISKGDLLTNKMASGRPQDLADVAELQRVD